MAFGVVNSTVCWDDMRPLDLHVLETTERLNLSFSKLNHLPATAIMRERPVDVSASLVSAAAYYTV
jgi:hypothetical protein